MNRKAWGYALAATAALLAGCGSSDNAPAVTSQVPASASQSVGGFISYLQALVVAPADNLPPVDVSTVTPPTDETSAPTKVD